MTTKVDRLKAKIIVASAFVLAVILLFTVDMIEYSKLSAQAETRTDIEVEATVGISAENKVGGIKFGVPGRWGYDGVWFNVSGFNKGLNLDNVSCCRNGHEVDSFNQLTPGWNTWLERFQEVLTEATTGEKLNTLNTPSSE